MKKFLPFMLIKAVLTAALFGGLPGVPRGIIKTRADEVGYLAIYENNQIFLLSEDTFISEMTAYRSPDSPKDSTVRFTDADATIEMSFEDIGLSGTTGSGSNQRDNVDISNARITLESSDKNYVVQLVLYGRTSPETILEDQNYFFYVSSGTKILSLPLQQIFGTLDLSKWWLLSAQLHEENRPTGYSDWEALPYATPVPINTEALYFSSRYIEFLVPEYNYLAGFNTSLYYHTSWGLMRCGNATIHLGDLPAGASFTIRAPTHIKVGTTQRDYFPLPSAYGIPQTYPANTAEMFIYNPTDASVTDTKTNAIYPTGAVFESPRLRFVLVSFLTEEINELYVGEPQDELVAGYNSRNIAAFDFFRVCSPANITLPPSPPSPPSPPEPDEYHFGEGFAGGLADFFAFGVSVAASVFSFPISIIVGEVMEIRDEEHPNIIHGFIAGLGVYAHVTPKVWNTVHDFLYPIFKGAGEAIEVIGKWMGAAFDWFKKFTEKIAPVVNRIWQWLVAFIGQYWWLIVPIVIAAAVAAVLYKNKRRR